MKKLLLTLAAVAALTAQAQQFEVVSTQQLSVGVEDVFHPKFTPDGKSLLVSSAGYDGIGIIDLKTQKYQKITDMRGAGWMPAISEDSKTLVVRQKDDEIQGNSLFSINLNTLERTAILQKADHFNQINFVNGKVSVGLQGKVTTKQVTRPISAVQMPNEIFVAEEDLKIAVYNNGRRIELDPLKGQFGSWDPQYIWVSLSPDKTKVLFHCSNNAYVCDLNGGNLVKLGHMGCPQWRGNNHVVGHREAHDGYRLTKGEILIVGVDGKNIQQLSTTSSEIKTFPAVSADGSQIAFHTEDGKLYLMTIKEK
ncbi:MAG: PD40 domain-containing protein [Paludibacteraceae bacterium]|nr:PD40 domain-containing protein [Paludibacteraceae bacterium]